MANNANIPSAHTVPAAAWYRRLRRGANAAWHRAVERVGARTPRERALARMLPSVLAAAAVIHLLTVASTPTRMAVLQFSSETLGPVVLGLGIAIAVYGLVFGSRDAIQKAAYVGIGGVILFSVDSLVGFIASAAG